MSKLSDIQKALKVPKSQFNNFGKYNYRSCEDILETLKPLLVDCTLTITDDIIMIGNRFYIKATATFVDASDIISVSGYAREEESQKGMSASQVTGSASSYARKYALNGLFLIDDTKDADTTNKQEKVVSSQSSQEIPTQPDDIPPELGEEKPEIKFITEKQAKRLFAIARTNGYGNDEIKTYLTTEYGIAHSNNIPADIYNTIIQYFEKNSKVI